MHRCDAGCVQKRHGRQGTSAKLSLCLSKMGPADEQSTPDTRAMAQTLNERVRPAGRIRLIIPRTATEMVIMPKLAAFARA
jgi:hypothetical protein